MPYGGANMMTSAIRSRSMFSDGYIKLIVESMVACLNDVINNKVILSGSFPGGLLGEIRGLLVSADFVERYNLKNRTRFLLRVMTRLETKGRISESTDLTRLQLLNNFLKIVLKDHTPTETK